MNTASIELTQEEMIQCDRQDRELEQSLAKHHIGTENVTAVTADSLDIELATGATPWALRAIANDALWWAFTAYLNKDRPEATATVEDAPDYLKALLADGADDRDTEQEGPLGGEQRLQGSSWQSWAAANKFLLQRAVNAAKAVGLSLRDQDNKKGFAAYLRTVPQELAMRNKRAKEQLLGMDPTEQRALVPEWLQGQFTNGVQTQQAKAVATSEARNLVAAQDIEQYINTCKPELALQPHEVHMLLERFLAQFEQSTSRDVTSPRLMNFDGTLKDEALGELAVADAIRKAVTLELEQLRRDFYIPTKQ